MRETRALPLTRRCSPFRIFTRRVFSVLILLWSVRSSAM
ncbi:hypothetical protein V412_14450 [Escherichia coli LAU-EC7]|nr:hypothetical protein V412_14450 [Escherichia coli LAU-EC7]